jgi:hypothetical protein
MTADTAAIKRFAAGARTIEVGAGPLGTGLWRGQYRRDAARTKALALMLAAAGPRDLRTSVRIDAGKALALSNEMQFHHFFPKKWLESQGTSDEEANILANIVMMTAISNQQIADQAPAAYLADEAAFCEDKEFQSRLESLLISPAAHAAALRNDYSAFLNARLDALLAWAEALMLGERAVLPAPALSAEVVRHGDTVEVIDEDTDD